MCHDGQIGGAVKVIFQKQEKSVEGVRDVKRWYATWFFQTVAFSPTCLDVDEMGRTGQS
jgi:hypothetical protein